MGQLRMQISRESGSIFDATQQLEESIVAAHEKSEQDIQWARIVEMELVPHPDNADPIVASMDYGMGEDGNLKIKLRAAVAGYMLLRWSVDCSVDHHLRGLKYQLWLKNHLSLYDVENAQLAPGYDGKY